MRQPDTTVLCRLCQLPAAQALTAAEARELLETALSDTSVCGVPDTVCALCELLPGTQALTAERLQPLLRMALPQHDSSTVGFLCTLPAAQQLRSAGDVAAQPRRSRRGAKQRRSATPTNSSRSSSPSSGGRLGGAISSSSSSSSSPVSRRSTSSSDCSFSKGSSRVGVGALCQQLSGAKLLQAEALEQFLLPC
jgi:hypothetical protein